MGVPFEIVIPEVEEVREGEPAEVVLENARRKARAGLNQAAAAEAGLGQVGEGEGLVALGVDTDVALDGRLLGKASDEAGARERLEALSGRTHEVLTGVVLLGFDDLFTDTGNNSSTDCSGVARSEVTFRDLSPETVERYLDSGEWRDRAGAYAIQGLGSILVAGLRGDFANVVGLPLTLLLELAPKLLKAGKASG